MRMKKKKGEGKAGREGQMGGGRGEGEKGRGGGRRKNTKKIEKQEKKSV